MLLIALATAISAAFSGSTAAMAGVEGCYFRVWLAPLPQSDLISGLRIFLNLDLRELAKIHLADHNNNNQVRSRGDQRAIVIIDSLVKNSCFGEQ